MAHASHLPGLKINYLTQNNVIAHESQSGGRHMIQVNIVVRLAETLCMEQSRSDGHETRDT